MNNIRHSVILIPSLHPDEKLISYVKELQMQGFMRIIIVNDGSGQEYEPVFVQLENMGCAVYRHAINYGKGRALKNGFNEFCNRYAGQEDVCGIITADSDGQHLVKDVVRMDQMLWENAGEKLLILGARNFNQANVPPKSKFGNKMTCFFFRLLYGLKVSDTQTGLRGITREAVEDFLALRGERFEYETAMLIAAVRKKIPVKELGIDTVYLENNSGTHFRPLQDSWMIYSLLFGSFLKYVASSMSASVIDLVLFHVLSVWITGTKGIWIATALARLVSSFYNYTINRRVVFEGKERMGQSLWRYYLLCIAQGTASAALVSAVVQIGVLPQTVWKMIVDTLLFFVSYQIQRRFVFGGDDER